MNGFLWKFTKYVTVFILWRFAIVAAEFPDSIATTFVSFYVLRTDEQLVKEVPQELWGWAVLLVPLGLLNIQFRVNLKNSLARFLVVTQACLETFFGLGLIVGPTLGGFLFQIGGFMLPFTVLGVLLISAALLTYILLPTVEQNEMPHSGNRVLIFWILTV